MQRAKAGRSAWTAQRAIAAESMDAGEFSGCSAGLQPGEWQDGLKPVPYILTRGARIRTLIRHMNHRAPRFTYYYGYYT